MRHEADAAAGAVVAEDDDGGAALEWFGEVEFMQGEDAVWSSALLDLVRSILSGVISRVPGEAR